MSTPYPPQPRRLMRDPSNKLVGGVCSGLAKYLNMDVNLVRILTVIISLFTGVPIVLYLIALFVMPEERYDSQPPHVNGPQPGAYDAGYSAQTYQQPTYGAPAPSPAPAPSQPAADEVWGSGGAPWEQPQPVVDEPTSYDTAPATGDAPEAPATAAPEDQPAGAPEPEAVPETDPVEAPAAETSDWESTPADPEDADKRS